MLLTAVAATAVPQRAATARSGFETIVFPAFRAQPAPVGAVRLPRRARRESGRWPSYCNGVGGAGRSTPMGAREGAKPKSD